MSLNSEYFNCDRCRHKHCDNDKTWPGSNGPAGYAKFSIDNPKIDSNVCFVPMISADSRALVRFYRDYDKGIMLFSGGIMDQPEKYLKGMEIISQRVSDHHDNRRKN